MNSVWTETARKPRFESLKEDLKTDVLIIGGGMAGILCACELQKAGVDYILAEQDEICCGITKNTTAKITSQHGLIYHGLIKKFGVEKARAYLEANESAKEKYRLMAKDIACDFEEKPSFVYSINDRRKIEDELRALEKIGFSAKFTSDVPLPFSISGAVEFERQAQFNPLKFAYAVAKGLRIFEHSPVTEIFPKRATVNGHKVKAEKIIFATHFPFVDRYGLYFLKMYQHRSYVLALKNAPNIKGMYVDDDKKGLSFRNYGELLLLGGGSHRTGERGGNWKELDEFANENYKNSETAYKWATQDCMTLDGVAYVGQYSPSTPSWYVATGFNKWGMTTSFVAAEIIRDMILDKKNQYSELFSPSRSVLHRQLFINSVKTVFNFLTPTAPRCSHLGCALKYNRAEHSWDCPCHGSRFDENKKLIDNPATRDIKS